MFSGGCKPSACTLVCGLLEGLAQRPKDSSLRWISAPGVSIESGSLRCHVNFRKAVNSRQGAPVTGVPFRYAERRGYTHNLRQLLIPKDVPNEKDRRRSPRQLVRCWRLCPSPCACRCRSFRSRKACRRDALHARQEGHQAQDLCQENQQDPRRSQSRLNICCFFRRKLPAL